MASGTDSDIFVIKSMKLATRLMKESSKNIRSTIELVKCAVENVTRTKRNIRLTTANVKDILLDSKSCAQDVKEMLSEAGIRGVIGETSRGIIEVTKIITESTHTINDVMLSVRQTTQVINVATKRFTRVMNKIMRASVSQGISAENIECSVRKAQSRTEFIKRVTDEINERAKIVAMNTDTSRRNTDRMRKITDYIQWNVKRVRNSRDDLEDVMDSISDIAKLYCDNLSAVNDLVSQTDVKKRYSYSDILDRDVGDLIEEQADCSSFSIQTADSFTEDTVVAVGKVESTEGMRIARENIKDATENVDTTAKTVDDISEAMKGMIIYNYISDSLNNHKSCKDISNTSENTFRDIMDMLNSTTESIASLNDSINECTDASNSIMDSISSTADALDDIMKIMGDDGEGKELFTVYIPKESESGYESTGTMTGDLMKVLTGTESITTDTDLTLTDVEVDEILKKDSSRIGDKRYARAKKNWKNGNPLKKEAEERNRSDVEDPTSVDQTIFVKDTTVTLNFREILTDVLESVENVLGQVENAADSPAKGQKYVAKKESKKPSYKKNSPQSSRADNLKEKKHCKSANQVKDIRVLNSDIGKSHTFDNCTLPSIVADMTKQNCETSESVETVPLKRMNPIRPNCSNITHPKIEDTKNICIDVNSFKHKTISSTYNERISKSEKSLPPQKRNYDRNRRYYGRGYERPKSSESSLDHRSVTFRDRLTETIKLPRHRHTMPPRTRSPEYLGNVFGVYPEWNYFSEDSFVTTSVDEEESPRASTWTYVETDADEDSCYLHDLRPTTQCGWENTSKDHKKKKHMVFNRCSVM